MLTRRICTAAAAAVAAIGIPAAAATINDPNLQIETVATGLSAPTGLAILGPGDFLVTQKTDGWVRRILNGVLQAGPVLDVAVDADSERGLLAIATDPDFVINRHVFLYYTESATGFDTNGEVTPLGNRVYRYTWNGSALVDPVLVLDLPVTEGPNHDGGPITFGPDGALYALIGDLNRRGKLQNIPTGPDPDDSGVILRVDSAGRGLTDNPFYNAADPDDPMSRYFAYGVRNSFGLAFDPHTGFLWDTENGPGSYDEVNHVVRGFNSGWTPLMGPDARDPQSPANLWHAPGSSYRDPEFSWLVPVAPTSLVFPASPVMGCSLRHDLLVADHNCGHLYRFQLNAARDRLAFTTTELQDSVADNSNRCVTELQGIRFGTEFGTLTDMEIGPDGRLYAVSLFLGALLRIGPKPGAFPDADLDGAADACDCAPLVAGSFAPPVEVPRLRFPGADPHTLIWDSQEATAGPGTTYTVVSGDLSALRNDGGFASACTLREGLTAPVLVDARPDPPAGTGHYYFVRADNACGSATFGDGTGVPDPRDPLDASLPPACPGFDRSGGALVRFDIAGESLTTWVTDAAFIDAALQHLAAGTSEVPIFGTLLDGTDCDAQWTWHADSADVNFAAAAIEVCDGLPSHVEADKNYWLGTVGSYCPWSARVVAVDDRR